MRLLYIYVKMLGAMVTSNGKKQVGKEFVVFDRN